MVTTKIGFGHINVSRALTESLKREIPGGNLRTVSYFDFLPGWIQYLIINVYLYGLLNLPGVLKRIYIRQNSRATGGQHGFWSRYAERCYAGIIKDYNPQLIIVIQGLACQWLARLKTSGLVSCPIVAVITDFTAHPFWVFSQIDRYFVATGQVKNDLIRKGIAGEKIVISGIPVSPEFGRCYNKRKIKEEMGLDPNKISLLAMGGGWGVGKMDKILERINCLDLSLEVMVVAGNNRRVYDKLKKRSYKLPVIIYGMLNDVSRLMAASDIIITKAGGVTVAEALSQGLVILLVNNIPGQEKDNASYLVKSGAAIQAARIDEIGDRLRDIIKSDNLRNRMQCASRQIGVPDSTGNIVREIKELVYDCIT